MSQIKDSVPNTNTGTRTLLLKIPMELISIAQIAVMNDAAVNARSVVNAFIATKETINKAIKAPGPYHPSVTLLAY